jgi:hypothetical protein
MKFWEYNLAGLSRQNTPEGGINQGECARVLGLDSRLGVIVGGHYAGIKGNAPEWAYLLAGCSTST